MKSAVSIFALMVAINGCATEMLDVKVTDDEGRPVTNAILRVSFSTGNVVFGGGHGSKTKSGHAEGVTDADGVASVKFDCQSADFGWRVEAPGYYRGESMREHFAFEEVFVTPAFAKVVLIRTEMFRASRASASMW